MSAVATASVLTNILFPGTFSEIISTLNAKHFDSDPSVTTIIIKQLTLKTIDIHVT